jgi:ribonuclease Z
MTRYFLAFLLLTVSSHSVAGAGFDGLRITLLGTGSPLATSEGYGPSSLVEASDEALLFDCGRGTAQRLEQTGISLRNLTAVFFTSLDSEHTIGCPEVWRARRQAGEAEPLVVWGPQGTIELVKELDGTPAPSAEGTAPALTEAHEIGENIAYQTTEVTVTAIVADFPPVQQAYAYRVDSGDRAVVLSGNTRFSENIIRSSRGVNVLVHEVAAADPGVLENSPQVGRVVALHTTPEEAGKVFSAARPYLAVYSHQLLFGVSENELRRRTRQTYRGALEIGHDLMVIEVQNEVQIRSQPSSRRQDRQ